MNMLDQYGLEVPTDLVLLPNIDLLSAAEIELVDDADWYEIDGVLCVSAAQINHLSDDDPADAGVTIGPGSEVFYVQRILHRYEPGAWYHA